jgi:RNA polymerase sigma factor (TIGR02999 family)
MSMGDTGPADVTRLLRSWSSGNSSALDQLVPMVYAELQRIADRHLNAEYRAHTLQPTALVHEAFLRLEGGVDISWHDRAHFFAVAAQVMRRVLVDHARSRLAQKRGGGAIAITLDESSKYAESAEPDVLDVDRALEELAALDQRQARIVELRFFGGMSVEETAEALNISPATVKREWTVAKTWIRRRLMAGGEAHGA